jgi:hypothetical protein
MLNNKMTELLFKETIEKIEGISLIQDISDFSAFYQNLPQEKASLYLISFQGLKNISYLLEGYGLERKEIERGALMFLATLNILFAEKPNNSDLQNLIEALKYIYQIELTERRDKILLGFLCIGLSLFKNFPDELHILNEKIIIGEFHNGGGFQPNIWGLSVNLNILIDLLNNLLNFNKAKMDKLHAYYKPLRLEGLSMITGLVI